MAIAIDESKITYSGDGEANLQNFDVYTKTEINSAVQGTSSLYDETATYTLGSYCIYNNTLYRSTTAITTPEPFTSSHWESVSLSGLKEEVEKTIPYAYIMSGNITTPLVQGQNYTNEFEVSVPVGTYLVFLTYATGQSYTDVPYINVSIVGRNGMKKLQDFGGKIITTAGGASPVISIVEVTNSPARFLLNIYNYTGMDLTTTITFPYTFIRVKRA